jgi:transcriptional regulator GlxA family with amidase domain
MPLYNKGICPTVHWYFAQLLQERFPECAVDMDKIFIADGQIWTSASMFAAADLAVAMIESDHGPEFARWAAGATVINPGPCRRPRRTGGPCG